MSVATTGFPSELAPLIDRRRPRTVLDVIKKSLGIWRARVRHRRQLAAIAAMGPAMLSDIGLSPEQVADETRKPFWKA